MGYFLSRLFYRRHVVFVNLTHAQTNCTINVDQWAGISLTCENVIDTLSFFFLAAKSNDETSSDALEQIGVTTNET